MTGFGFDSLNFFKHIFKKNENVLKVFKYILISHACILQSNFL